MKEKYYYSISDAIEEIHRLQDTLKKCITDAPYSQTIGATNRIGDINRIVCKSLRESGCDTGKIKER